MIKNFPRVISQKIIAKTRIFTVEEKIVEFSNGVVQPFETIAGKSAGAVMIVPMQDDETLLLIREYAAATGDYFLGFPKGAMDEGENPLESANRELMEETGFGARSLTHLGKWSLSPAYFHATMDIVLAKNLYPQKLEGDEPEPIEVIPWKISDMDALMVHPEFHESRSIAALLWVARMLKK